MPSTNEQIQHGLALFKNVRFFASLDDDVLADVVRAARRRLLEKNETLLYEGEASTRLYIVESGWLKAVKFSEDGREQVLHIIEPGEALNLIGVFTHAEHPGSVIAYETSVVWVVPQETVLRLLDSHPSIARTIISDLAGRVQHLIGLVADLSLRTVEARLARMLIEQADTEGLIERRKWATQTEIAARLGTVPDVLSRVFRTLADDGIITVSRSQIQILDSNKLRDKAKLWS